MTEREQGIREGLLKAARKARDAANRAYSGDVVAQAKKMGFGEKRLEQLAIIEKSTRLAWETFAEELEKEAG